ncbi:6-phosphofructokinase [Aneurinibacillus terranovensis]|uniref:6-phosphofructokinase n=1 Tax=Aneurinibacillus terranovensis TaxID=278991 RepID=UPI000426FD4B|nr:6-phosphofructokinase [Aneurinibacillus terranovensis]
MKKVAVITSGGDSSGINAVFEGILTCEEIELWGFHGGYDGICENEPFRLTEKIVKEHIHTGNALIRTARSQRTFSKEGREEIVSKLKEYEFDRLVVCGGEGSGKGASLLSKEDMSTLLIPMTIDNNIYGTDYTVGYHTACHYIADAVRRLRQTGMNLPDRIFMVETFGGHSGQLALGGAIAGGADYVLLPELPIDMEKLLQRAKECLEKQGQFIVLNCESNTLNGDWIRGKQGASFEIGTEMEKVLNKRVRYSILGYTQRAGDAIGADIVDAIKLGLAAAEEIVKGTTDRMVGLVDGKAVLVPLEDVFSKTKDLIATNKYIAQKMKIID